MNREFKNLEDSNLDKVVATLPLKYQQKTKELLELIKKEHIELKETFKSKDDLLEDSEEENSPERNIDAESPSKRVTRTAKKKVKFSTKKRAKSESKNSKKGVKHMSIRERKLKNDTSMTDYASVINLIYTNEIEDFEKVNNTFNSSDLDGKISRFNSLYEPRNAALSKMVESGVNISVLRNKRSFQVFTMNKMMREVKTKLLKDMRGDLKQRITEARQEEKSQKKRLKKALKRKMAALKDQRKLPNQRAAIQDSRRAGMTDINTLNQLQSLVNKGRIDAKLKKRRESLRSNKGGGRYVGATEVARAARKAKMDAGLAKEIAKSKQRKFLKNAVMSIFDRSREATGNSRDRGEPSLRSINELSSSTFSGSSSGVGSSLQVLEVNSKAGKLRRPTRARKTVKRQGPTPKLPAVEVKGSLGGQSVENVGEPRNVKKSARRRIQRRSGASFGVGGTKRGSSSNSGSVQIRKDSGLVKRGLSSLQDLSMSRSIRELGGSSSKDPAVIQKAKKSKFLSKLRRAESSNQNNLQGVQVDTRGSKHAQSLLNQSQMVQIGQEIAKNHQNPLNTLLSQFGDLNEESILLNTYSTTAENRNIPDTQPAAAKPFIKRKYLTEKKKILNQAKNSFLRQGIASEIKKGQNLAIRRQLGRFNRFPAIRGINTSLQSQNSVTEISGLGIADGWIEGGENISLGVGNEIFNSASHGEPTWEPEKPKIGSVSLSKDGTVFSAFESNRSIKNLLAKLTRGPNIPRQAMKIEEAGKSSKSKKKSFSGKKVKFRASPAIDDAKRRKSVLRKYFRNRGFSVSRNKMKTDSQELGLDKLEALNTLESLRSKINKNLSRNKRDVKDLNNCSKYVRTSYSIIDHISRNKDAKELASMK